MAKFYHLVTPKPLGLANLDIVSENREFGCIRIELP
jgi:hypothetical protein